MFNPTKIKELHGIVGLEQPFDPEYAILDADNLVSRSGYLSNLSSNPYAKIRFIKNAQDYAEISDMDFNKLIKGIQQASILEACNSIFNKPDFRERNLVYQYPLNKVNTTSLQAGFVCDKIKVTKDNNIGFNISRVILDFKGTGDITLQLYSSQQQDPLFSQLITITGTSQEEALNWEVNNDGVNYKAEYYLGYISNASLTPFKRDYERSSIVSCFTDLDITQVQFKGHVTNVIPNLTTDDGLSDYNGINADISVYDDYTDLILREEKLLAKVIDLQFQINLMRIYLGSVRSNGDQRKSNDLYVQIMTFIEGTGKDVVPKVVGIKSKLLSEITSIRKHIIKGKTGLFGGALMQTTIN